MSGNTRKEPLLIIYTYPLGFDAGGEVANDSWKYIVTTLSKKHTVLFFSYDQSPSRKKELFHNFFKTVKSCFFSRLIVFEPISAGILNKIYLTALITFLSFRKKIVFISAVPDERVFSIKTIKKPLYVYDCTDQVCDMNNHKNDLLLKKNERDFIKKCDLTFVNSSALYALKRKISSQVKEVPAGFPLKDYCMKIEKKKLTHKKTIVYIGAISFRLDFDLLKYVIQKNPRYSFLFIGPYLDLDIDWMKEMDRVCQTKKKWNEILSFSHVTYLGYKERREIAQMMSYFDIGIIPYNTSQEFNLYSNPVKFYDYLAMGIPVVSTDIIELRRYKERSHVQIAGNKRVFDQNLKRRYSVSQEHGKKFQKIVRANTVENKVSAMITEISKYVKT